MTDPLDLEKLDALLPCPFCGGMAESFEYGDLWEIQCGGACGVVICKDDEPKARAIWNSRVIVYPELRDRIRALEVRLADANLVARAATKEGDGSSAYWVYNAVTHGPFTGSLTDEQREMLRPTP